MPEVHSPSPRAIALDTLLRIERNHSYANLSLDADLRKHPLSPADKRLLTVLVYGVVETKLTLDHIIAHLSSRPIGELDPKVLMILRLGVYQLRFLDRIPPHAAVSESVALAGRRASGFVNACLREYQRRGKAIPFPRREDDPLGYFRTVYSIPDALTSHFLGEFDLDRTESILKAFASNRHTALSVNLLSISSREAFLKAMKLAGVEMSPTPYAESGVIVSSAAQIRDLPTFEDGGFFVQDEASQICVEALDARPGETIIDACSCPGSKSFGTAIRMRNRGKIYSFDLHESKLSLIESGAKRLGITIISPEKQDGKVFRPEFEGKIDRVLCDVPCSGFGVIGKKPDIRYKNPVEADRLPEIQYAILENNARYVRPGGVLVYSTCTIFSAENHFVIQKFLARHPEFAPEDFSAGALRSEKGMLALYPDLHHTDGFFVAKLRKAADPVTTAGKDTDR